MCISACVRTFGADNGAKMRSGVDTNTEIYRVSAEEITDARAKG
jgi:hypothetical protein